MKDYMTRMSANYGSGMHFAVQQQGLVTASDPNPVGHAQVVRRSATLYSISASLCTGKGLAIVTQLRHSGIMKFVFSSGLVIGFIRSWTSDMAGQQNGQNF
mmetsp:Transcript_57811/g.135153  ORF Transcript_57811/g.135153 Transcript_57811/m.135153 type:complete len:101 (+) Transcript_57811:73-375(+)